VFNGATKGPVHIEPDDSLASAPTVFRIVADEDARRFAEDYQTTARPPYLATVYSFDNAVLCKFAFNEYENTLRALVHVTAERDSARALADIRGREVGRLEREQLTPEEVEALRFALVEYPPKSGSYVVRTKAALAILDKLITGAKP